MFEGGEKLPSWERGPSEVTVALRTLEGRDNRGLLGGDCCSAMLGGGI